MNHRIAFSAAQVAAVFLATMGPRQVAAADFTATQIQYSSRQGKNAVLLTWNDPSGSPGTVTIKRNTTVIATVTGTSGASSYTAEDVQAGQFTFSAEKANGSLGSQVQTVLADHQVDASGSDFFGNPSNVTCAQQDDNGDCEIVIDWETGVPPPVAYDVLLDGNVQFSQPAFPLGAVISGANAGQRCVSIVSTMVVAGGQDQGRFRGEPVESCCTVTCGGAFCASPKEFSVGQAKYGAGSSASAVVARWKLPPDSPFSNGIKTLIRGADAGMIPGDSTRTLFDGLDQGTYEFSIQGDCGDLAGLSGKVFDFITLETETPHKNPVAGALACERNAETRQTTATWTNADPSQFIDVYIISGGARSYVTTIPGDQTHVTLSETQPGDQIELQFFAQVGNYYFGSEAVACGSSGNRFISSVCRGVGSKPDISSPIFGLGYLFNGGPAPPCLKACNVNGDDVFDLSDMVYILKYLFNGGPPPLSWGGLDPKCEVAPADECAESNEACAG